MAIAVYHEEDYLVSGQEHLSSAGYVRTGLINIENIGDPTEMKKTIALVLAFAMLITTAAIAGPKGFSRSGGGYTSGNKMFRSTPSTPQGSHVTPGATQGKTGTIQDLGLNPSAKTPADALKNKTGTPPPTAGAQAGPQVPQSAAPAFGGSGGLFGGSWMSWAFLGYLFGRHQQPTAHKPAGEIELVPDPD